MRVLKRLSVLLAALLVFAACDRATDPRSEQYHEDPVDLELVALDGRSAEAGGPSVPAAAPHLHQLLQQALRKIHDERGAEGVRRATADLRRLLAESRSARLDGNRALALRKMQEANIEAARIVVLAFGPAVVARTIASADEALAALETRLAAGEAAGEDVTRLRTAHRLASEVRAAAARAVDARQPLRALILATRVKDIVARA